MANGLERPDLEDQKNQIVIESAKNKERLQAVEDEILGMMASAGGKFLEDDALVEKLNQVKKYFNSFLLIL